MNGGMEECNHQSYCGVLHSLTLGPINPLISFIRPHTNTFSSSLMQNGFRTSAINPSWISLKSLTEWILSPYQGFVELVLSSPHAAQVIEKRGRTASLSRADVADLNPRQLLAACGCICTSLSAGWHVPWSPVPGRHCSCCSRGCKNNTPLACSHSTTLSLIPIAAVYTGFGEDTPLAA